METTVKFKKQSFKQRFHSMLAVDLKRMRKSKTFYILIAVALLIPIVMNVMLTMMDGTVKVDAQTGAETIMKGPESAWQMIGAFPGEKPTDPQAAAMGGMDVMSMCNINMMFMLVSVFICLFISDDFRSGFAKNLFTVREHKGDYVLSKTIVGFICGSLMLIFFFLGSMISGAMCGLSFALVGVNMVNIVMCMLSKLLLMLVFIPIFVLVSVSAKQKAWLSICGSLGAGMLLFMMVSMITPLESTIINVFLCLAGGIMFSWGLGAISKLVLKKTALV